MTTLHGSAGSCIPFRKALWSCLYDFAARNGEIYSLFGTKKGFVLFTKLLPAAAFYRVQVVQTTSELKNGNFFSARRTRRAVHSNSGGRCFMWRGKKDVEKILYLASPTG